MLQITTIFYYFRRQNQISICGYTAITNARSIFRDKGDNECHDWYPKEIVLYFSRFVKETISVNFNEIRHFFHFLFIVDLLIEITHED